MARTFDFVSHHPYFGILLWNKKDKRYNFWHPFAYSSLEDAQNESRVRDGVIVHWSWPSSADSRLQHSFDSVSADDLPF